MPAKDSSNIPFCSVLPLNCYSLYFDSRFCVLDYLDNSQVQAAECQADENATNEREVVNTEPTISAVNFIIKADMYARIYFVSEHTSHSSLQVGFIKSALTLPWR